LARWGGSNPQPRYLEAHFYRRMMEYDTSKRLLVKTLLKGLAQAVRRDDLSAAERYCERLRPTAESMSDELVKDGLEKLLPICGQWVETADVERRETSQQLLELIDYIIGLS
jgi:hypothetical protein